MQRKIRYVPLAIAAIGLCATSVLAQQKSQEELKKLYEAKLEESWFKDGGWTVDFDAAKERSKKENKVVFAYFSRSYSP